MLSFAELEICALSSITFAIAMPKVYRDRIDFLRFVPGFVFLVAVEYFQEESSCSCVRVLD
jgi:hypothetical protein